MIKVVTLFSYNQAFAPGLSALAPGLYTCIKSFNVKLSYFLKPFDYFSPDFTWRLLSKGC